MATGGAKTCYRSGKTILPMDRYVEYQKMCFLPAHFKCAATGVALTIKTCQSGSDPESGKVDVYLMGQEPKAKPTPCTDINDARVMAVPDSNMTTNARMFNIAGKGAERGATGADLGSNYGQGAVGVVTQTTVPDSAMRTSDRKFNIAGKGDTRDSKDQTSTSQYGFDAVAVDTIVNTDKPPVTVQNVNMSEKRNNGVDVYRNA